MRKHGWQLPYHPLQVVAVAVFLALAFAFYVFFAPFVGKKLYEYIAMGVYTPLILCVFGLYIWCAAADPADSGVFKSKKYVKVSKSTQLKKSKLDGETASSICEQNVPIKGAKSVDMNGSSIGASVEDFEAESVGNAPLQFSSWLVRILCFPCFFICKCMNGGEDYSDRHISEDGMFYCSLCEVEVYKYSKHCRVCDKCVDSFDHHCRWLNNCIGKRNYRKFFTLMVFSLLLLILQWSTGILVLICCFLDRKRFNEDIVSKLGSSFSIVPYVIVVVMCTILAMLAILPLAQLFFFHILLIKKGISTYDYIIALREQEQTAAGGGQQSPQMSQVSSFTGLSSASSFNTFHRAAWCTPPRLFVEDQYDVVAPDTASVSSYGKKTVMEEPIKKKNPAVKISPWALARLNAEEVSKAAAEARKKSKILQPISSSRKQETDNSFGRNGRERTASKRIRLPTELPAQHRHLVGPSARGPTSTSMRAPYNARYMAGSSPESSLDSPDVRSLWVSSCGPEDARKPTGLGAGLPAVALTGSTSDGYEASGGEDSDRVSYAAVQGQANWSSLLFGSNHDDTRAIAKLKASSSASFSQANNIRKH